MAETLHDAFIDELRDTYNAEKQLTKALPKLAKASSNLKLRQAFESHLKETQAQIGRREQVFESLVKKCAASTVTATPALSMKSSPS